MRRHLSDLVTRGLTAPALAAFLLAAPLAAQAPVGSEILVDGPADGRGFYHVRVGLAADGSFVATWIRGGALYARLFRANGAARGPAILVTRPTGQGSGLAVHPDGSFLVVWPKGTAVVGWRFDRAGRPIGTVFNVNATPGNATSPTVARAPDGTFVVAWTPPGRRPILRGEPVRHLSPAVLGHRVAALGRGRRDPLPGRADRAAAGGRSVGAVRPRLHPRLGRGVPRRRPRLPPRDQRGAARRADPRQRRRRDRGLRPVRSPDRHGRRRLVHHRLGRPGRGHGVRRHPRPPVPRRRHAQGPPVLLQVAGFSRLLDLAAAPTPGGGFLLVWSRVDVAGTEGRLLGRRFAADATPRAAAFQVEAYAAGASLEAALALGSQGGGVAAWRRYDPAAGTSRVVARRLAPPP